MRRLVQPLDTTYMEKKKVLIVTQELRPYTTESIMSEIARALPKGITDNGMDIRILMPRFGTINERRHRLHEVVRLSGMNIIVDDDDYPLIIKVASLPGTRMQVYFLDNDDFFKRKFIFEDKSGKVYADNADRMAFFCKGALEIVKKFGWPPDIIHCHGWMTSLIPFFLKSAYANEPLFEMSKVIYSAYDQDFDQEFGEDFFAKASINNLKTDDLEAFRHEEGVSLDLGAIRYADAVIRGEESLPEHVDTALTALSNDKPVLDFKEDDYVSGYIDLYNDLLASETEEVEEVE